MNNILVTGAAGFIGSNFVHYLLAADAEATVVSLDALTYAGNRANLDDLPYGSRHTFIEGDIRDQSLTERILQEHKIDTLVHFAAESHVDRSLHSPELFIDINVIGTLRLLEACRRIWLEPDGTAQPDARFLHISTDEVYGSLKPADAAFTETHPFRPNSPYAASKASADHLVRAYHHTYGLPVLITNCSNNYGPRQFPEKLIPLMILNALAGEPLPIYGDGQQIRDWLYVDDHCRALHLVLRKGRLGETYNIGGGVQPANLDLVRSLCAVLDELLPDSPHAPHADLIAFVQDRPGHDRRYAMDITKIGSELGWEPREDLDTGLRKTVHWYLDNPDWIASVRNRPGFKDWLRRNYAERGASA